MSESNALPSRSPIIGSQSSRQNLGVSTFSKPSHTGKAPETEAQSAATAPPPAPTSDGAKQRLTTFLSKLETTWQLFNRGTRESDKGLLGQDKPAFLDEKELPTQDTLKEMRARVAQGSGQYLSKNQNRTSSGPKDAPRSEPHQGRTSTKGSPESTRRSSSPNTPKAQSEVSGRPSPSWQPTGLASSRSFLATARTSGAQMRPSDAMGRPAAPSQTEQLGRQPVFSQSPAMVNARVTSRHVTSSSPVFHPFLDQHHKETSGKASPLRLSWGSSPPASSHNPLTGQPRLTLPTQNQGGQALAQPLSLHNTAAVAARADIATRFAGKAVHSLLKKLYDEEDLEELDEEEAVSGLGLILRLGGEFTYEHSTRVLDLALDLADEVGIEDQSTRREIEFGAAFRDLGELDLLLGSGPDSKAKMEKLGDFMGGQDMLRAGLLHDIGKVNIPAEILNKPGKLTPEEYELMKMHPIYGEEIVRPIASLRYLCPTIRGHHERWDGKGYPDGLSGEDIPIAARIISVADVFDALSAERPYKAGMEVQKVRDILAEGRGSHFDPTLVDAFLGIIDRRYPEEPEPAVQHEDT